MPGYWLMPALRILAAILLFHSCVVTAEETTYPLPIHYGGRVLVEKTDTHTRYTYGWPGVYFEARFIGNELDIKLDDTNNILNIIIDDNEPIVLVRPGKITHSLKNLGKGLHRVRLEKRTETQAGTGSFEGFYVPNKQALLKPVVRQRKMEFIGDSFTVGYGNLSPGRECSAEDIFRFTNTHQTFGVLTARHFNADFQINAISGNGIVRNYNGAFPDRSFVTSYPYTLLDNQVSLYKESWSPQIIVIGLGTNDFSTQLNPDEKWKSRKALQEDYVASYIAFIGGLRKQHPQADVILLAPEDSSQELHQQLNNVIDKLKVKGENKVYFVGTSSMELSACHWHPSFKDHQMVSKVLIDFIDANPQFWKHN